MTYPKNVAIIGLSALLIFAGPAQGQNVGELTDFGEEGSGVFSGGEFSLPNILSDISFIVGSGTPDVGNFSIGTFAGDSIDFDGFEFATDGSSGGFRGFSQKDIQKATTVAQNLKGLYSAATSGNVNGIISNLSSILGSFGLIDPQKASNTISGIGVPASSSSGSLDPSAPNKDIPPIKDAQSPSHALFLSRVSDSEFRSAVGNLAQITLGDIGQQVFKAQTQESSLAMGLSQSAQETLAQSVQKSVEASQASIKGAESSQQTAKTAQEAKDSQSVLKAIASQNAIAAQQSAINSGQLSLLASNQFQIGSQLVALQAQEKIQTDQLQVLQINGAAHLQASNQISNIVDRQLQYDQNKDQQDLGGGVTSAGFVYVPGYATGLD
ncbi:MAG: hypothetical protein MH252_04720 [Thermosynechococcaceae cyanobacterium MS004]|nr:hypothetical protein [Thermosynechococcaceae cyanobacterium MS004]